MKRFLAVSMLVGMIASVSAQTSSCVTLTSSLQKGSESSTVLALQNFLLAKGFLKSTPNGYFGPGTFTAMKAYQKSKGLAQTGSTGPATRTAIKTDSCAVVVTKPPAVAPPVVTPPATSTPVQPAIVPVIAPIPSLTSIDLVSLFAGGQTDWTFNLHGNNFSTSTNIVYFRNTSSRKTYTVGTFPSSDHMTITMPKNLTSLAFPCGDSCKEALSPGSYEVTVGTSGGQTDIKTMQVQSFTSSVQSGSLQASLPSKTSKVKFGTLSFSTSMPVMVKSVTLSVPAANLGYSTSALINQSTGLAWAANTELGSSQSAIVTAYGSVSNTSHSGTVNASFTVVIQDYIGKKNTTFVSDPFLVTIDGVL